MRFQNMTIHKEIDQAIKLAEKLLEVGSPMYHEIFFKNDWKFDNIKHGSDIAINLCQVQRKPLNIFSFKSRIPWSKSYGYYDGKGSVFINLRKLPFMTTVELTGMLLHEMAHYCSYTHGNNFKTKEKCQFSAPYFISENISKWL